MPREARGVGDVHGFNAVNGAMPSASGGVPKRDATIKNHPLDRYVARLRHSSGYHVKACGLDHDVFLILTLFLAGQFVQFTLQA